MNQTLAHKNTIDIRIRTFCRKISSEKPVFIPYRPVDGEELKECFSIVPRYISTNGGNQIFGWHIHVWKRVMVEAEFHCVWENPLGRLVDITPKLEIGEFSLFLPAPNKKYTGSQVDSIRKALSPDAEITTLIILHEKLFRHVNQGNLADKYGAYPELGGDDRFLEILGELKNLMMKTELKIIARYGRPSRTPTASY